MSISTALYSSISNSSKPHLETVKQKNNLGSTILVVEDNASVRGVVMEYLQEMGFGVIGAENGKVALDVLATQRIELVVTDMMMPILDGLSTLAEIRKSSDIPVIMVSGTNYELLEERLKQLSLTIFLSKPIDLGNLSKNIYEILEGRISFSVSQVITDETQYC